MKKTLKTVSGYVLVAVFIWALFYLGNRIIDTIKTNFFSLELLLLLVAVYLVCAVYGLLFFVIVDIKRMEEHSDGTMIIMIALLFAFSAFPLMRLIDKVFKTKLMEGVNTKN
ncbi:hypothetical protein [Bacillus sinesaloumensis]|uniref:hypothetical protein n=1 Tax=Litchfieldia sinesaloumensis TaxID=1926280 RepID=UPI000988438A|nr:hypothetical protein [Bacillus sinesaloumensis]